MSKEIKVTPPLPQPRIYQLGNLKLEQHCPRDRNLAFITLPQPPHIFNMLDVGLIEYADEIVKCIQDHSRSRSLLCEWSKPFIEMMAKQLLGKSEEKEINYVIVLRRVADRYDPPDAVRYWVEYIEQTHSVEEELWMLFLHSLNQIERLPKRMKARRVETRLVTQFRSNLKNSIRKLVDAPLFDALPEEYEPEQFELVHPDWYLLKNLQLSEWEQWLLWMLDQDHTYKEVSQITGTSIKEIQNDMEYLWNLAKSANKKPHRK